jgi:hypothetical protein
MNCINYTAATKIAKSQKLKSNKAFKEWNKENPEKGIPQHPEHTYKDNGWTNWYNFLGNEKSMKTPQKSNRIAKRMATYEQASEIAVREGIKSVQEYIKWKERPNNMPLKPNQTYAGRGWSGWRAFFKTLPAAIEHAWQT